MRHQNRIKDREREREKKVSSDCKNSRTHITTNKTVLATSTAGSISEQRGLYEPFGTKKPRTKRPRRDRAMQIAHSEKRNKGGTFKTGTRRSNEPTTHHKTSKKMAFFRKISCNKSVGKRERKPREISQEIKSFFPVEIENFQTAREREQRGGGNKYAPSARRRGAPA